MVLKPLKPSVQISWTSYPKSNHPWRVSSWHPRTLVLTLLPPYEKFLSSKTKLGYLFLRVETFSHVAPSTGLSFHLTRTCWRTWCQVLNSCVSMILFGSCGKVGGSMNSTKASWLSTLSSLCKCFCKWLTWNTRWTWEFSGNSNLYAKDPTHLSILNGPQNLGDNLG